MKISESPTRPVGILRLDIYRHGDLEDSVFERNLIVDGSKSILASLLGGAVSGKSVTKIGFGTNGTSPVGSNTALTGAYVKSVGSPTYATGGVTFPFTLGTSEGNGLSIIEFGLLTSDNTLFSRRVRGSAIVKDNTISLAGSWSIQF